MKAKGCAIRIAAICAAAILSACAATQPLTQAEKEDIYAPFKADPYVPVNVYINPGDWVNQYQAPALVYLANHIRDSSAFARIDRITRWPVSLEIHYEKRNKDELAGFAAVMVFAGTLGVVPVNIVQVHTLRVEVFHGSIPIKKLEYEETIENRLSFYDLTNENRADKAAIDRLIPKLIRDLRTQNLVPLVRANERPVNQQEM